MDVELTRREGPTRCAVCHDENALAVEVCDGCGATFHPECRTAVDGCSTLGCQRRTAPTPVPESSPTRRSRRWRALGGLANGAGAAGLAFTARALVERLSPGAAITAETWAALAGAAVLGLLAAALMVSATRRRVIGAGLSLVGWILLAWLVLPGLWPRVTPVTDHEVREVAEDLEHGFAERDVARLARRIDPLSVMRRHLPKVPAFDQAELEKYDAVRAQAVEELALTYAEAGGFRVLRVELDADPPTVLARVASAFGRVDYQTFRLARDVDGVVRVADFDSMRLASSWAEEFKRSVRASPTLRRARQSIAELHQQGTPEEVLAAIDRLGPAARRDAVILRMQVDATEQLDDPARHEEALVALQRALRGRSHLVELELAFVREDVDAGLRAVEAIDRAVGGDPFLDSIRAELHALKGDALRALELARDAATAMPDVERVWWVLLDTALTARDHAWTAAALDRLVTAYRTEVELIAESYDLTEFEASPEAAAWLALKTRVGLGR